MPVPGATSRQNLIRARSTRTGSSQSYWIHCWGGRFALQLPHMSGGSGFGRMSSSFRDLIQYCVGIGSFEADDVAHGATFERGVRSGPRSGVIVTGRIRAGVVESSHSRWSMATERRKWLPPSASAVWYAMNHSPSNSVMAG